LFDQISLPTILISYVALLFSLCVHEASHASAAYLLDDDTAARLGRMTINPMAHIDPIGTVLFPLMGMFMGGGFLIGWAKPVPFDPSRLTRKLRLKVSAALISVAGPFSNLVLAFLFVVITALLARSMTGGPGARIHLFHLALAGPEALMGAGLDAGRVLVLGLGGALIKMNILLAAFNIIPLGPLDGAGVLGGFLPDHLQYRYNQFRYHPYTWVALIALMLLGALRFVLYPLMNLGYAALDPVARIALGA
jgi:Zn-dependent protease